MMDNSKLLRVLDDIEAQARNARALVLRGQPGDYENTKNALRLIADLLKKAWEVVYGAQL